MPFSVVETAISHIRPDVAHSTSSGLLLAKTDATGHAVTQTYNLRGQTATRTLARGVVTTFAYDSATGELLSQRRNCRPWRAWLGSI